LTVSGGLVYFAEELGNKIGRLSPSSGEFKEWTIPTASSRPMALLVSGQLVYFPEFNGNKIGQLDTSSDEFAEWPIPTSSSQPNSIVLYGGLVYFTEQAKIGSLDPAVGVL
jgi:streptogramin lyase